LPGYFFFFLFPPVEFFFGLLAFAFALRLAAMDFLLTE
jgi:hypothetical protein